MPKLVRSAEYLAWTVGLLCGSYLVGIRVEAAAAEHRAALLYDSSGHPPLKAAPRASQKPVLEPGGVLGRLDIPALHLSTPIVDNDDDHSLLLGAGHMRGSALPGGLGNFVVAAHRDTYFRPLAQIRPGMQIRVITPNETFTYIVDSTKIVLPEDVDVLDIGDVPQMTLITCYPFHYIGHAPKRFTVSAHLATF